MTHDPRDQVQVDTSLLKLRDRVLLEIARCPSGDPPSAPAVACRTVVSQQADRSGAQFQVPEPWRGDIATARLLFVSSNPALSDDDDCPTAAASDEEIREYYAVGGFPDTFPWNRHRGDQPGKFINFWAQIRERAAECYRVAASAVVPRRFFALTEVVHCKSNRGRGVVSAAKECVRRHFDHVMQISPAEVVVVLGTKAAAALNVEKVASLTTRQMGGRTRLLAFLYHPASSKERTFRGYSSQDRNRIYDALK